LSLLGNAQKAGERQVSARVVVDYRCPKAATHWPWVAGVADPKMVGRSLPTMSSTCGCIFAGNDGYVESDHSHFWGHYVP